MEIGRERERERREKEKGKLFYVSRCGLRELRGDENGMGEQEGQRQTDERIEWGRNGTGKECGQVLYPYIAATEGKKEHPRETILSAEVHFSHHSQVTWSFEQVLAGEITKHIFQRISKTCDFIANAEILAALRLLLYFG